MDPNLIARILQRMRQGPGVMGSPYSVGQSSAPTLPPIPPGMYGAAPGGLQNQQMPPQMGGTPPQGAMMGAGVGSQGFAPPGQGPSAGMYGSGMGNMQGRSGINPMFLPNQQAEQALASAGQGQAPMNPLIRQIMQHMGILNMLRNRSAQPFMAQTQGY